MNKILRFKIVIALVVLSGTETLGQGVRLDWVLTPRDSLISDGWIFTQDIEVAATTGEFYLTGNFDYTVDFDPSPDSLFLTCGSGLRDIFLTKFDSIGNLLWAKGMGGNYEDCGNDIFLDNSGNVLITGYFHSTVDFDPGIDTAQLTANGVNADVFLAKYDPNGNFLWAKSFGSGLDDRGTAIIADSTGNIMVCGYFNGIVDFDPGVGLNNLTSAGGYDIFMSKFAPDGTYLWSKRVGGAGDDQALGMVGDNVGGAFITGYYNGLVDFDPGLGLANLPPQGSADVFLARYDANGNYVWAKSMGGGGDDRGKSVIVDNIGNIAITGYYNGTGDFNGNIGNFYLTSAGSADIFLAKYDATGGFLWAKSMGGSGDDQPSEVKVDSYDNLGITGYYSTTADFDPGAAVFNLNSAGGKDVFLAKYGGTGNYLWAISMGGLENDYGSSMESVASGSWLVYGNFEGTADFDPTAGVVTLNTSTMNGFCGKYDTGGTFDWVLGWGGYSSSFFLNGQSGTCVIQDDQGNIYVAGEFQGTVDFDCGNGNLVLTSAGGWDIFLAKYDGQGNCLWAKAFGGNANDKVESIALDNWGNVLCTGNFRGTVDFDGGSGTSSLTSAGLSDIFITKYDSNGSFLWARSVGGLQWDLGNSISLDVQGNVFVTGTFIGLVDFDPGPSTTFLTSTGYDIFIAKYDMNGNFVWAHALGGYNDDAGQILVVGTSGSIYLTGYYRGVVDFDPGSGLSNLTSSPSGSDVFLASYDNNGNYLWANTLGGSSGARSSCLKLDQNGRLFLVGDFLFTGDYDPGPGVANLIPGGNQDIFLAKYDTNGNYIWAKSIGGANGESGRGLAIDSYGNIWLAGAYQGPTDFDLGSGSTVLTSLQNAADLFIAEYDSLGNFLSVGSLASTDGSDVLNDLSVDGYGNVVITGYLLGETDFSPYVSVHSVVPWNASDFYLAKYRPCVVADSPSIFTTDTSICPNTPVQLSVIAGNLNGADDWYWYSDSCSGMPLDIGATVLFGPPLTTTYYVRGLGECVAPGNCGYLTLEVNDTIAPIPTTSSLPADTVLCNVTIPIPSAMDNCLGIVMGSTTDPLSYNGLGTYTIFWVYDDGNGNSSSQMQTIVVVDTLAPVPDTLSLPDGIGNCSVTLSAPTATDNCGGTITGTTVDSVHYTQQGVYAVTWVYDDGNGNVSTQMQTVIVDDTVPPVADIPFLPDAFGDCFVTVAPPTATDNCSGSILGLTYDSTHFDQQGIYTVTWIFDDTNGNISTQTQIVIVEDTVAPNPDNALLPLLEGCVVDVLVAPTATDNCSGNIAGNTMDPINYTIPGVYWLIWTFEDGYGNISTQNQQVLVWNCNSLDPAKDLPEVGLYPNPSNGYVTLVLNGVLPDGITLRVTNMVGEIVGSSNVAAGSNILDFTHLPSAIYLLRVEIGSTYQIFPLVILPH